MTVEVTQDQLQQAARLIREHILRDPVGAALQYCQFRAWSKQADIIQSTFHNRLTVVHTGHAVGKTESLSIITILWVMSHPDSWVIVTAADWPGVQHIFQQLAYRAGRCRFPGITSLPKVNKTFWDVGPLTRVEGFSPEKPEPIQGHHSHGALGGTLVIGDEFSGGERPVFIAMLSNLTIPKDHLLLTGNPLYPDGCFVQCINNEFEFTGDAETATGRFRVIHISSYDTPNFDETKENIPGLASPEWIEDVAKPLWVEGTPEWDARVLGQIPDQSEFTFIPISLYKQCKYRKTRDLEKDLPLTLSVDPARSSTGDRMTLALTGKTSVHWYREERGWDLLDIKREIYRLVQSHMLESGRCSISQINIDGTGIGSGLCDVLQVEARDRPMFPKVRRCLAASRAHDIRKYANQRAEMYGLLKEAMADRLAIPEKYHAVFEEVTGLRYKWSLKEQIQLERKQDYKERNNKSPDAADVLALGFIRDIGDAAFDMLSPVHQMSIRPLISRREDEVYINLEGHPAETARPGALYRSA
ncbi:MAG: hypothetical protein ABIJ57_09680, partial [Pseudomonadota bacterium]